MENGENMTEHEELNEAIDKKEVHESFYSEVCYATENSTAPPIASAIGSFNSKVVQWSSSDGRIFIPTATTTPFLTPGYYEIDCSPEVGIYFEKVPISLDNILIFPDAVTDKVLKEIQFFWEKEDIFKQFGLTYKRGQLLWGPQGSGKSTTLQLISKDVIDRGGIVIRFGNPGTFISGLRKLREIQPDTPVVVLMEDIDAIIRNYNESSVINILDGVDKLNKIVFLATTNYPSLLGDRICNRPSRFDKRHKVGFLNADSRKLYIEFLKADHDIDIDIDQWVKDSNEFSIAHLKELFIAVVILGDEYESAIATLKSMKIRSNEDASDGTMGLRAR